MPNKKLFRRGQSTVELAIFGSILIFVISMIFRQGLNGGNFMNTQLKATRYALSRSFSDSVDEFPGRRSAAALVIEDRLGGDFTAKLGGRDRAPQIAASSASFTNQLFYPITKEDFPVTIDDRIGERALPHYDVWINGQKFAFTTANFKVITIPATQGAIASCGSAHPTTTWCWDSTCPLPGGCLVLHRQEQNYPGSTYSSGGNFDVNFTGTDPVAASGTSKSKIPGGAPVPMAFMWHWVPVQTIGKLPTENAIDVDGDFYEEQIIDSTVDVDGRTQQVWLIDRQDGDIDMTLDGRRPGVKAGLLDDAQMFSFSQSGTLYRIKEGKLYSGRDDQYIRNTNVNDQADIVQRIFQLSKDTGRFCSGGARAATVDGEANPVEACGGCFTGDNMQKTCLDTTTMKLYVRSRIQNSGGRSWFTRTESSP